MHTGICIVIMGTWQGNTNAHVGVAASNVVRCALPTNLLRGLQLAFHLEQPPQVVSSHGEVRSGTLALAHVQSLVEIFLRLVELFHLEVELTREL